MQQTATAIATKPCVVPLKCIQCGGKLAQQDNWMRCAQCGKQWPVQNGIPRFYQPEEYYWGEISRQKAMDFLAHARAAGWKQATETDIHEAHLRHYYLDLQRASWLALLGLDHTAVALDIGSGYGAITHSLALSVEKVCSIEAIPERIEFTQERLHQERITNVSLFQASATSLPFFENSFDLVVANGVLEWVGEWDQEGSPREGQLRFLSSIRKLLKDDGVLVIGIENRFGMPLLRGGMDHSGLPYTSLVPRWLATRMLQHTQGPHFRMTLNSKREYRTFTYSHRGYKKLLAQAGFGTTSVYWAHPGYNKPLQLVPLEAKPLVTDYCRFTEENFEVIPKMPWRPKVKSALSAWLAPEFLLVARKHSDQKTRVVRWLEENLDGRGGDHRHKAPKNGKPVFVTASTHPYCQKSTLQFWNARAGRITAVAKVNTRLDISGTGSVESGFKNLMKVREKLLERPELEVTVPEPIGCLQEGNSSYALESAIQGVQFSRIINQAGYVRDIERVRKDFARAIKLCLELSGALQEVQDVPALDASWYRLPDEVTRDAEWAERVKQLRYFADSGPGGKISWNQHGDFWPEHIFWDTESERAGIIDWDDLAGELPPFYDVFSLILYSRLLNPSTPRTSYLMSADRLQRSFTDIFLQDGPLAKVFNELLADAFDQARFDPGLLPSLLAEFLLIRAQRYLHYGQPLDSQLHLKLLRAYMDR